MYAWEETPIYYLAGMPMILPLKPGPLLQIWALMELNEDGLLLLPLTTMDISVWVRIAILITLTHYGNIPLIQQ